MKKILFILGLFSPSVCQANGGLPIIWVLNTYALLVGIIFVFVIERAYLKKIVKPKHHSHLSRLVIKFNCYSTLFGVLALPMFMIIVQLEPIGYMIQSNTTKETMTRIWWISLTVDLFLAYLGTVFIEYLVLKNFDYWSDEIKPKLLLKHSFVFNAFSYLTLCAIVFITFLYFKLT